MGVCEECAAVLPEEYLDDCDICGGQYCSNCIDEHDGCEDDD